MLRGIGGYATIFDPDSGLKECDTFTCFHCNRIVHVKPKCDPAELGGHCKVCDKLICDRCVGQPCIPFLKKLERWEARHLARKSYG